MRNTFWRAVTTPISDVHPIEPDDELQGSLLVHPLGRLTIALATFNRQRYTRNETIIASGGLDHYLLHLVLAGGTEADFRQTTLSARSGDIYLIDLTRPYTIRAEAGERITVVIPREPIDLATGGRLIHGLLLPSDEPLTRMLKSVVVNLHENAGRISKADTAAAEAAAIDFIAAIIGSRARSLSPADAVPARTLRQHILGFIDAHLTDSRLGTALLMHHFRISRAHLYRVFAADGGVATMIRDRRLDFAHRQLMSGGSRSGTVTGLAYDLGFTSSRFSRAFRARFGVPPSTIVSEGASENLAEREVVSLYSHFARQAKCWSAKGEAHKGAASRANRGILLVDEAPRP